VIFTEHAPLGPRHTLRVAATASWLVEVTEPGELAGVLDSPQGQGRVVVLGEGSNVLFTTDFDGLVLRPAFMGIDDDGQGGVRVGAGENWHRFVHWSLDAGYVGLENLALIPGSVGAAPIQNIGAYGTELHEFVEAVEVHDRHAGKAFTMDRDACGFGYRDSLFKRELDRYIVVAVRFRLPRERPLRMDYSGVREELEAQGVATPTAGDVARAVEAIRRRKLPDPQVLPNAGSFFKNPMVESTVAERLRDAWPGIPTWPAGGLVKLSAAWMLERCGFKGARDGDAGFAGNHALVLVNYGTATGVELAKFANHARTTVADAFGIDLEIEPRII
jgi:UDP-N-acetylmuramate dehydrogenase